MTKPVTWPTLEEVAAADTHQLLDWNATLPAPRDGTANYDVLVKIVTLLRERHGAEGEKYEGHRGWPLV
jgi:hypothetical protein